jgi:ribokinase
MIAVVGSVNRDLIVSAAALPGRGETVLSSGHVEAPGGKGANQAVAAARLGATVSFVGRVGDDAAGRMLAAAFSSEGVDVTHLAVTEALPSGLAVITVDAEGENTIVVDAGANALVGRANVASAAHVLRSAKVTLLQLEIPMETVVEAAAAAGGTVVVNAAPATPLPDSLSRKTHVVIVNVPELETLTGSGDPGSAAGLGAPVSIVTLGAEGAALVTAGGVTRFAAPEVAVVDTTGAGDAFCGAVAAGIDAGLRMEACVQRAVVAAALATTALGARTAMPTAAELDAVLPTQG